MGNRETTLFDQRFSNKCINIFKKIIVCYYDYTAAVPNIFFVVPFFGKNSAEYYERQNKKKIP